MASITSLTLEAADPAAARTFYDAAFHLDVPIDIRASDAVTSGFRGFTLSLVVSQPSTVDSLIGTALDAGAKALKPATKSLWGYGGVVQAPDGAIWKVATSKKKNAGPATRHVDDVVILLGTADIIASKRFYIERGMEVKRSFGRKYVEFAAPSGAIKLGLYGRGALAKDAGVAEEGSGSHQVAIGNDVGTFTDPDGFAWTSSPR